MNPGFRYHIASLASVFFALGIGVVMGTLVVGGKVVDRQARLVQQLERRMEDLQVDIKRRGQSDVALLRLVGNAAPGLWRAKSVSIVSVAKANTKKIAQTIGELGPWLDTRNVSLKDDKWVSDDDAVSSPTISLKLDGTDDFNERTLIFVMPANTSINDMLPVQRQGLVTLMTDLMDLKCKVIVVTADDGNAAFLQECVSVGIPVVTNAETSVGLSALMLSPFAKPAVYGAGPYSDEDLPTIKWSVSSP